MRCFSSTHARARSRTAVEVHFSFVSILLRSVQWHALGREEQAKYYELARRERQLHMQLYPDWSSRANTQRGKKRKRKQETTDGGTALQRPLPLPSRLALPAPRRASPTAPRRLHSPATHVSAASLAMRSINEGLARDVRRSPSPASPIGGFNCFELRPDQPSGRRNIAECLWLKGYRL